ncbi:MAG: DUF2141 domain-containing protein [Myxococcales bacterium]|nr:MAG: DUF2141 domain-containing protein [Myxococcales bacterium]
MTASRSWLPRALALGAAAAAPLLYGHSAQADDEESVATNVIEFETQNRNDKGVVRCGLFNSERAWLKETFRPSIVKISGKTARCIFKEVPAGVYGISAFHDEDNNGKINTNLVGYPTEQYCSSNDARNMFSAPSWKDAKFKYKGGTVRLRGVMK